jgi:hypothetical protein
MPRRWPIAVLAMLGSAALFAGCGSSEKAAMAPMATPAPFKADIVESMSFGKARIAVGMTKEEVLAQIKLSREQYQPLESETAEIFMTSPTPETIQKDTWSLMCPSRNSHMLGGGSGIMLHLEFRDNKVVSIRPSPWLGA